MALIGISGKIGSGKDTVGKIIQYLVITNMKDRSPNYFVDTFDDFLNCNKSLYEGVSTWQIKKFAGKLKQCVSIITGIPVEDLEKEEVKQSYLGGEWDYISYTPIDADIDDIELDAKREVLSIEAYMNQYNIIRNDDDEFFITKTCKMTVCKLLQTFGTEIGRQLHPNTWINALFVDYITTDAKIDIGKVLSGESNHYVRDESCVPNWIITDTRFPNEAKAIKDRDGIIIRVERDIISRSCKPTKYANVKETDLDSLNKIDKIDNHPSETALDNYKFDYTIDNNGTIEKLIVKVKEILIKEKII
jgi:hypothetical protein